MVTRSDTNVIQIIACDPSTRMIQGRLKDKTGITVSVRTLNTIHRWPQVGEMWLVKKQGHDWFLQGRYEGTTENVKIEDVNSGDVKIDGNNARLNDGSWVLSVPNDVELPLTVTGSRSSGAALVSLLTVLADAGIITNNTTT